MNWEAEFKNARETWHRSTPLWRTFIVLSLFFPVSSVTSLADMFFGWKGFILDGVEFYRSWVTEPLIRVAETIGLSYTSVELDILVVSSIYVVALIRTMSPARRGKAQIWHQTVGIALLLGLLVGGWLLSGITTKPPSYPRLLLITMVLAYIVVGYYLHKSSPRPTLVTYFAPGALAAGIVLLLGALNAGLEMT